MKPCADVFVCLAALPADLTLLLSVFQSWRSRVKQPEARNRSIGWIYQSDAHTRMIPKSHRFHSPPLSGSNAQSWTASPPGTAASHLCSLQPFRCCNEPPGSHFGGLTLAGSGCELLIGFLKAPLCCLPGLELNMVLFSAVFIPAEK